MTNTDKPAPHSARAAKARRAAGGSGYWTVLFIAAGLALAALSPWPAGIFFLPLSAILGLACWNERRRAARYAAEAAEWQNLLAPYLPELPALVSQLQDAAGQLEGAVLQACDGFHDIGARARQAVGSRNPGLDRDIGRVVVALQFQDIVNQRITHAIETLTELGEDLGACVERMPLEQKPKQKHEDDWEWRLARTYALDVDPAVSLCDAAIGAAPEREAKNNIEIFLPEVSR